MSFDASESRLFEVPLREQLGIRSNGLLIDLLFRAVLIEDPGSSRELEE
jgi:hypothetical protein